MDCNTSQKIPLTAREKATCTLAWVQGMTNAAIAVEHGVASRTIETRLYRARRRMLLAGIAPPARRRAARRVRAFSLTVLDNV